MVQIGLGEGLVLKDYHPDTLQLYNMNMDLRACLAQLADPATPHPAQSGSIHAVLWPEHKSCLPRPSPSSGANPTDKLSCGMVHDA